jgi:shikimate dehydrogenase
VVFTAYPYDGFGSERFDLVVNATSAGLSDAMPQLPDDVFAGARWRTKWFMAKRRRSWSSRRRAVLASPTELGMLVEQAAESFFIWRESASKQTAPVIEKLRREA